MSDQQVGSAYYDLTARDAGLVASLSSAETKIRSTGTAVEQNFGGSMDRAAPPLLASTARTTTRIGGIFAGTFNSIGSGFSRLGTFFSSSPIGGALDTVGAGFDKVSAKSEGLGASLVVTGAQSKKFGGIFKDLSTGILQGVGIAAFTGITGAISGTIGMVKHAISAASDMQDIVYKTGAVFGAATPEVLKWGDTAATALGMSKAAALQAAGTFGNLFLAMQLPISAIAPMSEGLIKVAADLAAFNHVDPSVVLDALQQGLNGRATGLRQFGIVLDDAIIKEKAYKMGLLASVNDALTPAIKAQAAYQLILEQSTTASGAFAKSTNELAGEQKVSAAKIEDAYAKVGAVLLPLAAKLVPMLTDAMIALIGAIGPVVGFFEDVATFVGKAHDELKGVLPVLADLNYALPLVGAAVGALSLKLLGLGSAGLGAKLGLLAFVAETAQAIQGPLDKLGNDIHDKLFVGPLQGVGDFLENVGQMMADAPWPIGPKGAPEWAGGTPTSDSSSGIEHFTGKLADDLSIGLNAGVPKVDAAAGALVAPISAEQQKANDEAARIAALTPYEIAKSLREGADPVKQASALLADAAINGLNPMVEQAQLKAALASKRMRDGLKDGRPEVRAATQAWKDAVEERLFALQNGVPAIADATSVDYATALAAAHEKVRVAANAALAGARATMIQMKADAGSWGTGTGSAYITGLNAGIQSGMAATGTKLAILTRMLAAGSPPKPGAVLYGIEKWGAATGDAYVGPLLASLQRGATEVGKVLGGVFERGVRTPTTAMALAPRVASGGAGSNTSIGSIHIQVVVEKLDAADPAAVRDLGRKLGNEIRLTLTRSPTTFVMPNA